MVVKRCYAVCRYTSFHTTALCSPTRAALLTGRNHHSVHTGTITETATGYPGYDTLMPKDSVALGEVSPMAASWWAVKLWNAPRV